MFVLSIDGTTREVDADAEMPLLWVLRDLLNVTGPKFGCGAGLCGACTVHLDEDPVRACQVTVGDVAGAEITTIQGVNGPVAEAVRDAWRALDVVQCGYCQPGQMMEAIGLLTRSPRPSEAEIVQAMDGVICRCGTYPRIRAAIAKAAEGLDP